MKKQLFSTFFGGAASGFLIALFFLKAFKPLKSIPQDYSSPQTQKENIPNSHVISNSELSYVNEELKAFGGLSGLWNSAEGPDELKVKIDGRIVTFRATKKWRELDGVTVLMGKPQADFFYSGKFYMFTFIVDEETGLIRDMSINRHGISTLDDTEDIPLEREM